MNKTKIWFGQIRPLQKIPEMPIGNQDIEIIGYVKEGLYLAKLKEKYILFSIF